MRTAQVSRYEFSSADLRFESEGTDCVGRLYRPDRPRDAPAVVLAPGLGMARTDCLPAVAKRYAARGYAAFAFDYRGWGDSDGEPRHLIDPERQQEDLRAAVRAVRRADDVDGSALSLWGVDVSAGHALAVAGEDPRIRSVVARCPVVEGATLPTGGLSPRLRGVASALLDRGLGFVGRSRSLPILADPGTPALVALDGGERTFRSLLTPGRAWENATPARSYLAVRGMDVTDSLPDVSCPSLFVAARDDEVAPADTVESASEDAPVSTFLRVPGDHYGTFDGDAAEQALGHELAFLDAQR